MKSTEIEFSVVIPTYNRAHLIGRAVQSVLEQRRSAMEVIVVDDGSSDNTAEVVQSFGAQVRYLHQQNAGSAKARDNGFRTAKSPWIALLDSDDLWLPHHLERMADAIAATDGQANYYFADCMEPPEKGGRHLWDAIDFSINGDFELCRDGTDWVVREGRQPTMLQASVFKRSAYLAAGGFHPLLRYRDDTHLFMKLGINAPICAVAGCGVEMTGDDIPENRLTLTYDHNKCLGASMFVILYQDLLTSLPHLSPTLRKRFHISLAAAHRRVARCAWKEQRWGDTISHIRQSLRVAPIDSLFHLPAAFLHPGK